MKRRFRMLSIVAVAAVSISMPGRASASGPFLTGMCSPGNLVCTTARFWISGSNLMFDVFNGEALNGVSAEDSRLSGLVIFGMPIGVTGTFSAATFYNFNGTSQTATNITSRWTSGVLPPLQNMSDKDIAFKTTNASAGVGTCNVAAGGPLWDTCDGTNDFSSTSDYVEFRIALSGGTLTDAQLALLGYGWKAQSVTPGGNSVECSTNRGDAIFCDDPVIVTDDGGTGTTLAVTPEPATMSLLATGLVGLGMGGLRRRRKKS